MFKLSMSAVMTFVMILIALYFVRENWIKERIATLNAAGSSIYAAANAALPHRSRIRIVLIGDSRIKQWPSALFPIEWDVINRGVSGETSSQTVARFKPDALALNADVIIIETGINDLVAASFMDQKSKKQIAAEVGQRILALANEGSHSGQLIIITTILPPAYPDALRRLVWNNSLLDLSESVNAVLRRSKLPARVKIVDLAALVIDSDSRSLATKYRADTLHINLAGYEKFTSFLTAVIRCELGTH